LRPVRPAAEDGAVVGIPEFRYARNGEIALAYQVLGDGPIDLVYVPQFVSNIEIVWENPAYARFLRRLASFSRLITLDRRGTGLSDRLSTRDLPPPEVLMEDLGVVMRDAGSERAVLFGASDSGCLCALFAATHPDRAAGLIAFATAAVGTAREDYRWLQWDQERWDRYLEEMTAGWGTQAYASEVFDLAAPSTIGDVEQRQWWARLQRQSASPNSAAAIERIWAQIDIRPALPTIQAPTLVLHSTGDRIEQVEAGRDFASRIPGARFVELAGDEWTVWTGDQDTLFAEIEGFVRGIRDEQAEMDRVLATVVFTDIVSSTERAAALGDRGWHELLDQHHAVVRAMLGRYRGHEVETAGDGFLATFDGPARAVHCARAIADAVRPLGLEIRAGVHTGEIELDGEKVRGIAVHIGSRVGALAGASEVLVSQTVKDLVAGSGLAFEDAGEHELKGVPDRWRLYRVTGS
jgi:class 3 adenylate cyclase